MHLQADKLSRLKDLLAHWSLRKSCRRQQLESSIGTLQHACRVVKSGRAFLRRAIDLLRNPGATKGHHHLRLNREFRADLQWWKTFAVRWNGVSMFPCPRGRRSRRRQMPPGAGAVVHGRARAGSSWNGRRRRGTSISLSKSYSRGWWRRLCGASDGGALVCSGYVIISLPSMQCVRGLVVTRT